MVRRGRGNHSGARRNTPVLRREEILDEIDSFAEEQIDVDSEFIGLGKSSKANANHREMRLASLEEDSDSYEREDSFEGAEEEEGDADLRNAMEEEEGITSAWGKKKKLYYDNDVKGLSRRDHEEAEIEEEEEAKRLRMERIAQIEDDLYEDEMLGNLIAKQKEKKVVSTTVAQPVIVEDFDLDVSAVVEKVEKDLSNLTAEEKIEYLKENRPEVFELVSELDEKYATLEEEVLPLIDVIEGKFQDLKMAEDIKEVYELMLLRKRLILSFCKNVSFCLMMAVKGKSLKDHPVESTLNQLSDLLENSVDIMGNLHQVIERILTGAIEDEKDQGGVSMEDLEEDRMETAGEVSDENLSKLGEEEEDIKDYEIDVEPTFIEIPKESRKKLRNEKLRDCLVDEESEDDDLNILTLKRPIKKSEISVQEHTIQNDEDGVLSAEEESEHDAQLTRLNSGDELEPIEEEPRVSLVGPVRPDPDYIEGRRAITKKIMKNQGLKRYRKRENKNPRLRHRHKYEKAVKKRNMLVKSYSGKVANYGGEATGIKDYVIKSTRIA